MENLISCLMAVLIGLAFYAITWCLRLILNSANLEITSVVVAGVAVIAMLTGRTILGRKEQSRSYPNGTDVTDGES